MREEGRRESQGTISRNDMISVLLNKQSSIEIFHQLFPWQIYRIHRDALDMVLVAPCKTRTTYKGILDTP